MGAVFKKTVTKALPTGAEIFVRKEKRFARWKDTKGHARTAEITVPQKGPHVGEDRIVLRAKTFIAKYRDGSGVIRIVPTGCRDETAARFILADLEKRAVRVKSKMLTAAEDAVVDHLATPLGRHLDNYFEHLESLGRDEDYRQNTRGQLERLFGDCEFVQLVNLDSAVVERWLTAKTKVNMSARTRNSYRIAAVGFGNWLVENGRLVSNPFTRLPKADEAVDCRRKRRSMTEAELVKLLDVARRRPLLDAMTVRRGKRQGQAVANVRRKWPSD